MRVFQSINNAIQKQRNKKYEFEDDLDLGTKMDPNFKQDLAKCMQEGRELDLASDVLEKELLKKGEKFYYTQEIINKQDKSAQFRELVEKLQDHPDHIIWRARRNQSTKNKDYDYSINLRPRNHELIQYLEIPEHMQILINYIGIKPARQEIKIWTTKNGFTLPALYYKSNLTPKSMITVIHLGLCDSMMAPEGYHYLGYPCIYDCQHKPTCQYVHLELAKKDERFRNSKDVLLRL